MNTPARANEDPRLEAMASALATGRHALTLDVARTALSLAYAMGRASSLASPPLPRTADEVSHE